jgi:hypothetical protein
LSFCLAPQVSGARLTLPHVGEIVTDVWRPNDVNFQITAGGQQYFQL